MALGALVQGIPVADRAYAGGWWDWLTPFSLLTGVALVVGYALLGATWLVSRPRASSSARPTASPGSPAFGTLALIGVVSLWTPFLEPRLHGALVGLAAAALHRPGALAGGGRGLRAVPGPRQRAASASPFLAALALFVLSYIGLGISFYPYIVPASVTIWEPARPTAASPSCSSARPSWCH